MIKRSTLGLAVMLAFPILSHASGYHFGSQSASNQGVANAGAAAVFDASTVFYNPAGLSRLKGNQLSGVLTVVVPKSDFTDTGSTINVYGTPTNIPIQGSGAGDFTDPAYVPHLYYSNQLTDTVTFGLGAFVPFGSKTTYDENWTGRYNIVETELKTMAINPSMAWKLNNSFSIGAGLSAQYMAGKLFRHVNFGAAGLRTIASLPTAAQPAAQAALADMYGNADYDGTVEIEGEDWAYGFNLGAMWNITDQTRIGMAYRSAIRHRLAGDADWTTSDIASGIASRLTPVVGAPTATVIGTTAQANLEGTYVDSGASLKVDTPESFSLNAYTELNAAWALMADFTWTRHSRFKQLRIDFASTVPDSVTVEDWDDTTRWSLGTTYKATDKLMLKGGAAIDFSPVDDDNRTASIPDNRRTWFSLGASYAFTPKQMLDFAYTYITVKDSTIRHVDDGGGLPPNECACSYATLRGEYELSSHLVGLQYSLNF